MKQAFIVLAAALLHAPLAAQSLTGVWKPVEVVVASGATAGRHTADVQPGLLIFTDGHYAWLSVNAFAPRPSLSANPTDEERGRVWSQFTGQGGTFEASGSKLTLRPIVAKNPSVMSGTPATYALERDGSAYWVIAKTADGVESSRMKLVRVENQTSTKASPAAGGIDPQKLIGTWELVSAANANTGAVDPASTKRRQWLMYTDKNVMTFYTGRDRQVISPEEFRNLTPAQQKDARFARYYNEAEKRPVLGGSAGGYKVAGSRITYDRLMQTDPYSEGRPLSETVLRLDDQNLIVRVDADANGVVREETWRRID